MCETPQPPSSPCLAPLCFSSLHHNQITFGKEMDNTLTPHFHPWEGDSGISCWEGERRDHFQTIPHGESHPGWTSSSMAWFSLWETFWVRRQTSPSCCFYQDHSVPPFPCVLAHGITGRQCGQAGSGAPWKEVLMGDRDLATSCPHNPFQIALDGSLRTASSACRWQGTTQRFPWNQQNRRCSRNRDELGFRRARLLTPGSPGART